MHNLTNKQIAESVECCVKADCKSCPLYHYKEFAKDCEKHIITMLKDENERLNSEVESLQHYKSLYEDLKTEHLETIREIKKAKSEAVREFAERLKEEAVTIDGIFETWEVEDLIDNLVKEMAGDGDA